MVLGTTIPPGKESGFRILARISKNWTERGDALWDSSPISSQRRYMLPFLYASVFFHSGERLASILP